MIIPKKASNLKTDMLGLFLIVFSVSEAVGLSTECFFISRIEGTVAFLEEMYCEHGCCGTIEEQECCGPPVKGLNRWMVAALVVGGAFVFLIILVSIYCIIKYNNHKKQRIADVNGSEGHRITFTDFGMFQTRHTKPSNYTIAPNASTPNTQNMEFKMYTHNTEYRMHTHSTEYRPDTESKEKGDTTSQANDYIQEQENTNPITTNTDFIASHPPQDYKTVGTAYLGDP